MGQGGVNGNGQIRLDALPAVSRVRFDVEGGTQSLPSLTTADNSDFSVSGGASIIAPQLAVTGSVNLSVSGTNSLLRVASINPSASNSITSSSGGELRLSGNFNLQHTSESLVQRQTGKVHFDGASLQSLEIGGQDVGIAGTSATNSGNFGIGQLIVGTATQKSTVKLTDFIDNGNRNGSGGAAEALYLYGIGGQSGLQLLNNSTLALNGLNVYAWGATANTQVHLNSLFAPGINRISYSGGTLQQFANLGPYIWTATGDGTWGTGTNWTPNFVPDGDEKVIFGNAITGPTTITVNGNYEVSELEFNNATHPYTLSGSGAIELVGSAEVNVIAGSHTIDIPLSSAGGFTKTGQGTLRVAELSHPGPTHIQAGTLKPKEHLVHLSQNITVDEGATFDVSETESGQYLLVAGQTLTGRGKVIANTLFLHPESELRGDLEILGNVTNIGRIAPGFSTETMVIAGNYSQHLNGALEMEVGGTSPGSKHDMLIVTGAARLSGRLDVPIVGGYVPQVGDSATVLLASSVTGDFSEVSAPDLADANPNVAIAVNRSATDVKLQFVAPLTNTQVASNSSIVDWNNAGTWNTGVEPDTRHIISIQNPAGVDQRVDVQSDDAFVHELTAEGDSTHTVTIGIKNGRSLSATAKLTVGKNAVLALGDATTSGFAVIPKITIQNVGTAKGNGRIRSVINKLTGKRNVLTMKQGNFSPGYSVGFVSVEGDYEQDADSTLFMKLASPTSFDKFEILGEAKLAGTLDVSLLSYVPQLGDSFDILDWETVIGTFDTLKLPPLPGGLAWKLDQLSQWVSWRSVRCKEITTSMAPSTLPTMSCGGKCWGRQEPVWPPMAQDRWASPTALSTSSITIYGGGISGS